MSPELRAAGRRRSVSPTSFRKDGRRYRAYLALERLLDRGDGPGSVVLRITDG